MKKRRFLANAALLTVVSLLISVIDMTFKIVLSSKVGSEGMGLYQLVFSVYSLGITFSTSGVYTAVTRLAAEELGKNRPENARSYLKKCILYSLSFSLAAMVLFLVGAPFIASTFLGDMRAVLSLRILALSLPFLSVCSCFRGYFFACEKILKSTSTQVFEEFICIVVTAKALTLLLPAGLTYACAAIVIGATVSEFASFLYGLILFLLEKTGKDKPGKASYKKILGITLPVAGSSYVRNILSTVENLLIPNGIERFGASPEVALSQYGLLRGMVMPVLSFPAAFLFSFSRLLIPEIARANGAGRQDKISGLVKRVFQLTLLFSVGVTGAFIAFSGELGHAIYQSTEVGQVLRIMAPLVPLLYLDSVVDGILTGLGQQLYTLKINIADSAMRALFIFLLVPLTGFRGVIYVTYFGTLFNATLSIRRLVVVTKVPFRFTQWVLIPACCAAGACLTSFLILHQSLLGAPILRALIWHIALALPIYLVLLAITKCFTKEDRHWLFGLFHAS